MSIFWSGLAAAGGRGLIAALFLLAAMLIQRTGTDRFSEIGGLAKGRPALATLVLTVGMLTLAVPGSANFAGEFTILTGAFLADWRWAAWACLGVILGAEAMRMLAGAGLSADDTAAQADVDAPAAKDLYDVGTIAPILQLLKLPDGTVKVLVEGVERATVAELRQTDYFTAVATPLTDGERYDEREMDVLVRSVVSQFEQYVKLNRKVPPEVLTALAGIEQPGRLADMRAKYLNWEESLPRHPDATYSVPATKADMVTPAS